MYTSTTSHQEQSARPGLQLLPQPQPLERAQRPYRQQTGATRDTHLRPPGLGLLTNTTTLHNPPPLLLPARIPLTNLGDKAAGTRMVIQLRRTTTLYRPCHSPLRITLPDKVLNVSIAVMITMRLLLVSLLPVLRVPLLVESTAMHTVELAVSPHITLHWFQLTSFLDHSAVDHQQQPSNYAAYDPYAQSAPSPVYNNAAAPGFLAATTPRTTGYSSHQNSYYTAQTPGSMNVETPTAAYTGGYGQNSVPPLNDDQRGASPPFPQAAGSDPYGRIATAVGGPQSHRTASPDAYSDMPPGYEQPTAASYFPPVEKR